MIAEWDACKAAMNASTAAYNAARVGTGTWADYHAAAAASEAAVAKYSAAVCKFTGRALAPDSERPLNPGDETAMSGARFL